MRTRIADVAATVLAVAKWNLVLLLCAAALAASVSPAVASHFMGASLIWAEDPSFHSPSQSRFFVMLTSSWRRELASHLPFYDPPNATQGMTITSNDFELTVLDRNGAFVSSVNLPLVVQAVNYAEDWIYAEGWTQIVVDDSQLPVTVRRAGCCRADTLEGNADQSYMIATVIDPSLTDRSLVYRGLPVIHLQQGSPAAFQLLATELPSLTNTWAIAPYEASFLITPRPVGTSFCSSGCPFCYNFGHPSCADGLRVSHTGLVTWTPQIAGDYAVQFTVTGRNAGAQPRTSTPIDMILKVVPACSPPACKTVTVSAPPTVSTSIGTPVSFAVDVNVSEPGTDVTLIHTELPYGATLSPTTGASPIQATLNWTPPSTGNTVVCFAANTNDGSAYSYGQACTTISVGCPGGLSLCGLMCLDSSTDLNNCGACGHVCPNVTGGTRTCTSGVCGGTCPPGLHVVSGACVDINECATNNGDCGAGYSCVNMPGSFECQDIDECSTNNGGCGAGYTCVNTPGAFECQDVNECATKNGGCTGGYICINMPGTFTCQDVDECSTNNGGCGTGYTCVNSPGTFACQDIDECATSNGGCVAGYTCVNTPGTFACQDIDECATNNGGCGVGVPCINAPGSHQCGLRFTGFFQPVDNPPVTNVVNAGRAIPVKFSLSGYQGMGVLAAGYPVSGTIGCQASKQDAVEQTVTAGSSSLSYDAATDQYVYVWKTDKAWAGTCRKLTLRLVDGSDHVAYFTFTR